MITVDFGDNKRKLGTVLSAANEIISIDDNEYHKKIEDYKDVLKRENDIINRYSYSEKEMVKYKDYF